MSAWSLSRMEQDAVGEMMNISMGAAASAMSGMLGKTVRISLPVVSVQSEAEFILKELEPADGVEILYTQGIEGKSVLLFRRQDLGIITGLAKGSGQAAESVPQDEEMVSVVCEVMNQMMGASATSLSEFLGREIRISTPSFARISAEADFKKQYFDGTNPMVIVRFVLEIDGKLKSIFLNMLPVRLAKEMIEPFAAEITDADGAEEIRAAEERTVSEDRQEEEKAGVQEETGRKAENGMEDIIHQMQQTQREMLEMMQGIKETSTKKQNPEISSVIHPLSPVMLEEERESQEEDKANQEMLLQVPLEVSVEIGRTKKLVRDILEFTQGSLVVLDKMAGEQVDLFVNGQCIAKGDIVVVEDNFGIRITEILPGSEYQGK